MSGYGDGFGKDSKRPKSERNFTVYINEGEMHQIYQWVLKKDNIETGGDLFGLWVDQHTAVVQFVLGPGEGCRRTNVSFFQDVKYLQKAGKYLTAHHGLCNIGQWHSHHRLSLSRPSAGDENTVWRNMPKLGMDRYIVFIANINHSGQASVNCFLFETEKGNKLPVLKGEFASLQHNSPFRLNESVLRKVFEGAESFNSIEVSRMERSTARGERVSSFIESASRQDGRTQDKNHGSESETPSSKQAEASVNNQEYETEASKEKTGERSKGNDAAKEMEEEKRKEKDKKHKEKENGRGKDDDKEKDVRKSGVKSKHNAVSPSFSHGSPSQLNGKEDKNKKKNNGIHSQKALCETNENVSSFCGGNKGKATGTSPVIEFEKISSQESARTAGNQSWPIESNNNNVSDNRTSLQGTPLKNGGFAFHILAQPQSTTQHRGSTYDNVAGSELGHVSNMNNQARPETPSGTITHSLSVSGNPIGGTGENCDNVDSKKQGKNGCGCCIL